MVNTVLKVNCTQKCPNGESAFYLTDAYIQVKVRSASERPHCRLIGLGLTNRASPAGPAHIHVGFFTGLRRQKTCLQKLNRYHPSG